MKRRSASSSVKTPDQVRAEFERNGTSVTEWAVSNGFNPNLVFEVLGERVKARRGKSHKIAVLLGLKDGEVRA